MDAGGGVSDHCGRHIDCLFVSGPLQTRLHSVSSVMIGSMAEHFCPLANLVLQFKLQFDDNNVIHPDSHLHSVRVCRKFGLGGSQHFYFTTWAVAYSLNWYRI